MTPRTVAHQALLSMCILQARILEWVAMPSFRGFPNPGIEPRFPALQAASLPSEQTGMPVSTRVGSLSLLQGIFPTQESNKACLHCRWILHQLSYHGSLIHQDSQYVHQGRRWSHALFKSMPALEPPETIIGSVAFTMIRFACLALHIGRILQFILICVLFL